MPPADVLVFHIEDTPVLHWVLGVSHDPSATDAVAQGEHASGVALASEQAPPDTDRDDERTLLGPPEDHGAQEPDGSGPPPEDATVYGSAAADPSPGQAPPPPASSGPQVAAAANPVVARLRFEDGQVLELDRPYLLGRQPDLPADDGRAAEVGWHVVADERKELSRTHLEVRPEDGGVVIEDQGSGNGTWVTVPGQQPKRLEPFTPEPVPPGTTVHLSDVTSFTLELPT